MSNEATIQMLDAQVEQLVAERDAWEGEYLRVCGLLRKERKVRRQLAEALKRCASKHIDSLPVAISGCDCWRCTALAASDVLGKEKA